MNSVYERDHVLVEHRRRRHGRRCDLDRPQFRSRSLRPRNPHARSHLNFEEKPKTRRRSQTPSVPPIATVVDDPTAKQHRARQGRRLCRHQEMAEAANLPVSAMKKKSVSSAIKASGGGRSGSKVHKPHLGEMHGPEFAAHRPGGATPQKPFVRQRQQNLPAHRLLALGAPRSSGGAPGHRGGWKKR